MYPLAPHQQGRDQVAGTWRPQRVIDAAAMRRDPKSKATLPSAFVCCPRCGKPSLLDRRTHRVDEQGSTPVWDCPARCGFKQALVLHGWASEIPLNWGSAWR